jgi:pimeloyl-ACP methyl ester carboxylesterase
MRRIVALAATASLVLGGAAVASAAQAAPLAPVPVMSEAATAAEGVAEAAAVEAAAAKSTIKWGKCASAGLQSRGAQCGFLSVPLDYKHPTKTKIKLAVSRIKHTVAASKYQGIMLTNPGGPGGSGLTLSVLGEYVPNNAGKAYDWIGFDPRGVGSSTPSLACDGKYFGYKRPDYNINTTSLEKFWLKKSKGYAKACDKAGGKLLDHLKTTDTVKDMESIRKALGASKINFYGFSYGTYLGQVYSTLYPTKVRRMVLDGNVDPRGVWYKANLDQDIAFDRNIKIFFEWIAKYDSVYHLGTSGADVEKVYYAQRLKLRAKAAGGYIGPNEWTDIFTQAGYYVFGWQEVANAFAGWVNNGDWATLKALYDNTNAQGKGADNGFAVYLGVQCTDVKWPTSWAQWKKDNTKVNAKAPFLTWSNVWFNAPCLYWGAKPGKPVSINGKKAPAILLIGETLDAATPYEGSLEVRSRFPKSVLIEGVGGTTHSGSLSGVTCTDNAIAAYLLTGKLPKRVPGRTSDLQCDPVPVPDPTAVAAQGVPDNGRAELQKLIGIK